ncbi:uncharacterized protein LOC131805979 [Musca domestica]|uniref:Uncharacterized protein LOC131805979 n=1 Tax=Musca domestica TaxID=7370 RepID=A0ABM3VJ50_MUSDO|nr:uncharacterized protein LOC131805979 [Musca domestica]
MTNFMANLLNTFSSISDAQWGWTAIAIAYLIKIKVVIVAFFLGSAVYLGLRYFWPHKCQPEIILDHPPPSFSHHHHDHIPYSSDHSEIISSSWGPSSPDTSFEPYSAYAGSYASSDVAPPDVSSPDSHTYRIKREIKNEKQEGKQMGPSISEERIGNFMFMFLGLDSAACRRRFVCEMEFRSKNNPLTAMAFRVIGRSFFAKYTNDHNEMGKANSFEECAAVNSECVFIENDVGGGQEAVNEVSSNNNNESEHNEEEQEEEQEHHEESENQADNETPAEDEDLNVNLPTEDPANNSLESNNIEERANYQNLMAERRNSYWRRRLRGDRQF